MTDEKKKVFMLIHWQKNKNPRNILKISFTLSFFLQSNIYFLHVDKYFKWKIECQFSWKIFSLHQCPQCSFVKKNIFVNVSLRVVLDARNNFFSSFNVISASIEKDHLEIFI